MPRRLEVLQKCHANVRILQNADPAIEGQISVVCIPTTIYVKLKQYNRHKQSFWSNQKRRKTEETSISVGVHVDINMN